MKFLKPYFTNFFRKPKYSITTEAILSITSIMEFQVNSSNKVLNGCYNFLRFTISNKLFTTSVSQAALLFSSLMHDIDHPGRNNEFMKNSFSPLSILYNDQSVLLWTNFRHLKTITVRWLSRYSKELAVIYLKACPKRTLSCSENMSSTELRILT
jgi:hypothetical protein